MANYNLTDQGAVSTDNPSVEWKQTTATPFVTPTWSSATRAVTATDTTQNNWNFANIQEAIPGFLQGRRPNFNLLFPRGYYNK
tara:strand:+ start:716 stop:964 length:249 start_codon:yes stop_codon:yes gene_type:complete